MSISQLRLRSRMGFRNSAWAGLEAMPCKVADNQGFRNKTIAVKYE